MTDPYEALRPSLEDYMLRVLNDSCTQNNGSTQDGTSPEEDDSKLPLQLAIVGRPNVGNSTLLNALLQEDRVLVGAEAGLTRDSLRVHFEYQGRTLYLVDTAGWLQREKEKGPASLRVMQSRKNLMRAHVVALVLDAEGVTGIPVVFASALEGRGGIAVMHQVIDTYQKWCLGRPPPVLTVGCTRLWAGVLGKISWPSLKLSILPK